MKVSFDSKPFAGSFAAIRPFLTGAVRLLATDTISLCGISDGLVCYWPIDGTIHRTGEAHLNQDSWSSVMKTKSKLVVTYDSEVSVETELGGVVKVAAPMFEVVGPMCLSSTEYRLGSVDGLEFARLASCAVDFCYSYGGRIIGSVLFSEQDGELSIKATDGHRAVAMRMPADPVGFGNGTAVSRELTRVLSAATKHARLRSWGITGDVLRCVFDKIVMEVRIAKENRFPDFESLNSDDVVSATVGVKHIENAMKELSRLAKRDATVSIKLDHGVLWLSPPDCTVSIKVDSVGAASTAVQMGYLVDAVKVMVGTGSSFVWRLPTVATHPMALESANRTCWVMPIVP